MNQVRVYAVEKANGWDVLNPKQAAGGIIPKTVIDVHITWGDGKGEKTMKLDRATFIAKFHHVRDCYWEAV